ncbi:MAG: hypothetical protein QME96_03365 [Myxococcota bacterium]|nr:hypothetical protein [Myxococcota bacterium]
MDGGAGPCGRTADDAAVKRALGLAFLHATHQNGILIQIWSTLAIYQVLQDLRLEIAARSGWHEDDVSWTMLMRRIGWYVQDPEPGATLREWLVTETADLHLRKRGVRQRRLRGLPAELLAACDPPPTFPDLTEVYVRTPRQGDRRRAKKTRPVVLGGLT